VDLLSGEPTGYFYAATFSTLFNVIDGYVRVTGNHLFVFFFLLLLCSLLIFPLLCSTEFSFSFPLGDTEFLLSEVIVYRSSVSLPLIEYMTQTLALNSLRYSSIAPGLADYGPNPNTFLE
jgi:hypothetical protein